MYQKLYCTAYENIPENAIPAKIPVISMAAANIAAEMESCEKIYIKH
jgi:hypothetical protein